MFKLARYFFGGYIANPEKLQVKKVKVIHFKPKKILIVSEVWQGYGRIKGTTKKIGTNYSPVPVCVFRRDTRQLLWEIKSKSDGSYEFRNIKSGFECFVIAFDPNNQYNAAIQDKVIAK